MENAEVIENENMPDLPAKAEINSKNNIVMMAVQNNYSPEMIEKMMDLQDRMEKKDAKKAYFSAMANFKKNPPKILKGSKVDFTSSKGRTNYNYASLAEVTQAVSAALAEHGLNVSWRTEQTDGKITVTVRLTHELGYYEETSLTASPDQSGNKNSIQAIASTVSYLERYTLLAITGLATHDMDDDGKGSEVEYISEKQLSTILDMINAKNVNTKKFLSYMNAESCEKIPVKDFKRAVSVLKQAKGES